MGSAKDSYLDVSSDLSQFSLLFTLCFPSLSLFRMAVIGNNCFQLFMPSVLLPWLLCSFQKSSDWCFSLQSYSNFVENSSETLSRLGNSVQSQNLDVDIVSTLCFV